MDHSCSWAAISSASLAVGTLMAPSGWTSRSPGWAGWSGVARPGLWLGAAWRQDGGTCAGLWGTPGL